MSLEDLKLTEKEKAYIAKEYGTFIYDELDSDYFTKKKMWIIKQMAKRFS
ncbi:hypothetical protein MUB16_29930 [Priestia sp. OVL9]|nr:hypothetical protein [Priestia sp. OVL9]